MKVKSEILDLNQIKFVLQKCNLETGQWETTGLTIIGKKTALKVLNSNKAKDPSHEWRVVPKVVADAYKQGWADALYAAQEGLLTIRPELPNRTEVPWQGPIRPSHQRPVPRHHYIQKAKEQAEEAPEPSFTAANDRN